MTLRYFIDYNLRKGLYLSAAPIITVNWKGSSASVWTVPFGGGPGRVFRLGTQPVNAILQVYGNAARPANGSTWGMRLQIALLFPEKSHPQ